MSITTCLLYKSHEQYVVMKMRCQNAGFEIDHYQKIDEFSKLVVHKSIQKFKNLNKNLLIITDNVLFHRTLKTSIKDESMIFRNNKEIYGYYFNQIDQDSCGQVKNWPELDISLKPSDLIILETDLSNHETPVEYLFCDDFKLKVDFAVYLKNSDILLSQHITSLQLHNIVISIDESILTNDELFYYYLIYMLSEFYYNKTKADKIADKFRTLIMTYDCHKLIYKEFNKINQIITFYPYNGSYTPHEIKYWTSNDILPGRELITEKMPVISEKYNWLLLNNMPVKITCQYTIQVVSNRPEFYKEIVKKIPEAKYFDGSNYKNLGYSKLVNDAVKASPTEIVIIMGDKVRPEKHHVDKLLSLLSKYGIVSMYYYAFFGFRKELFRQIGFFDERFDAGGYEDWDFRLRLYDANIPVYECAQSPYNPMPTSWNYYEAKKMWDIKWIAINNYIIKTLSDKEYDGSLGKSNGEVWYDTNLGYLNSNFTLPYESSWYSQHEHIKRMILHGYK